MTKAVARKSPVLLFGTLASLSLGIPQTMLRSASSALFLKEYPASALAYTYLAVAVVVPLTAFAFMQIEKRLSPLVALLSLEFTRLIAAIGLWIGFSTSVSVYIPVVAVIWVEVDFVLGSFVFWGLAGLCINITQAKSAYPRMTAGQQLGALLIGLLTPPILMVLTTIDLFWLAAASYAAGTVVIFLIAVQFPELRQAKIHNQERAGADERPPPFNRQMRTYVGLILALAFFTNIGYFVLDNLFYSEAAINLTDEKAMASFLSIAFGAAGGVTLLFSLFIAPRLLVRFSIGVAVSWLPAMQMLFSLSLIAVILIPTSGMMLPFVIATVMKMADEFVRASISRPSAQALYQPIPSAHRIRAMATSEGFAEPLGIATAGVALLLVDYYIGFNALVITTMLLSCTVLWLVVTILLRSSYITALSLAVSRRQNIETGFSGLTSQEAKRLVLEKLASDQIADRLSAADMLRKVDPAIYKSMIPELLRTGEPALLNQLLPDLPALAIEGINPILKQRLDRETDAHVRGQIVLVLARTGDAEATKMLSLLSAKTGPLQDVSLAALVGNSFGRTSEYAGTRMRLMSKASDPASRRVFLAAVGRSGSPAFDTQVVSLFEDTDPEIRRMALHAAGRSGRESFILPLWERFMGEGTSLENANVIARALSELGEGALLVLQQTLAQGGNRPTRVASATALGLSGSALARNELVKYLDDAAPDVSYAAAMSLWKAQVRFDPKQTKVAFAAVEKLLQRAAVLYQAQADVAGLHGSQLLHDGLQHRITQLTIQSYVLAALTHGIDSLKSVQLASGNLPDHEKSVAIELMDSLLPPALRQLNTAINAELPLDQRIKQIGKSWTVEKLSPERRLAQLVTASATVVPWVRACALTLAADAGCKNLAMLIATTRNESGLVGETARHLALAGQPPQGETTMSLSTIEKVLFLKSVNLFKLIPDEYLAEFAPVMLSAQYGPGEVIMNEGELGDSLYIIVFGEVEILLGGNVVDRLGQRAVVGELAALDPEKRTATVRAVGECHVLALSNQHIGSLMVAHPGIAESIIRELCSRLRSEHALKRQRVAAE